MGALKLGMEQGLQGQIRAPGKGDFKDDNSKGVLEVLNTLLTLYHHHSVFS
jgi:hypothetical protein